MNPKTESGVDTPQIWHFGLMARNWIEFFTDAGQEGAYFQKLIEQVNGPALDLGCGSGRLLLPFLQAGLDVEGADYSADMLAVCEKNLANHGVQTRLHRQGMHELDLDKSFDAIFSCGVIGVGGSKKLTQIGMQRCYEHLNPGGIFAFDYEVPWNHVPYWHGWAPEGRQSMPTDWFWFQPRTERRLMSDGTYLENAIRIISQDSLNGTTLKEIRFRVWHDDEMVQEEVQTLATEGYLKDELILMLKFAGFEDVEVLGNYNHEPATTDDKNIVFIAKK